MCGNTVYCMAYSSNVIHGYLVEEDQWKIKLNFPRSYAALTNIKGLLTGVGGLSSNELTSWKENGWEKIFRPMSVERYAPAVVSNRSYVIVAGGFDQRRDNLTSIEVFDIYYEKWATIADLPHPFANITATLCGGRLYVGSRKYQCDSSAVHSIPIESIVCHVGFKPSKLSTESKCCEHIRTPVFSSTLHDW